MATKRNTLQILEIIIVGIIISLAVGLLSIQAASYALLALFPPVPIECSADNGIVPCFSGFESLTYVREATVIGVIISILSFTLFYKFFIKPKN